MCEPTLIASVVMGGLSLVQQDRAAHSNADALSAANQTHAEQVSERASAEMSQVVEKARRDRGRMRAAAAESGLATGSRVFQLQEINSFFREGKMTSEIASNADSRIDAATERAEMRVKGTGVSGLQVATTLGSSFLTGMELGGVTWKDLGFGAKGVEAAGVTSAMDVGTATADFANSGLRLAPVA